MKNALIMTVESVRTRVSTQEALVTLAVPLEHSAQVSSLMNMVGQQLGVAFADIGKSIPKDTYGKQAKALRLSTFFRMPDVWKAVGTDEQFLEWLRGQPCAYCGEYDYLDDGRKVCEAAHVRRVSSGAGTSIKPPYSAIPLCHAHHTLQHVKGESELGPKEWYNKERINHLQNWCWEKLKQDLGYDSWKEIAPEILREWAKQHKLQEYLPSVYY